jgi:hypothetical protein
MANINGADVVLQLRENGTTGSYLSLVCETDNSMTGTTTVTTTRTKCEVLKTVSEPEYSWAFNAVVKVDPSASEVSYEQLLSWFNNGTLLDFKRENPSGGANFYQAGTVYISDLADAAPEEGFFTFSGTLQMTGALDIIA